MLDKSPDIVAIDARNSRRVERFSDIEDISERINVQLHGFPKI